MKVRRIAAAAAVAGAGVLFAVLTRPEAAPQRDMSKVEIKATHVAGSVWMLEGAGGNMTVSAGPDGILLIDDQFAPLSEKIRAAIAKIDPGPIRFVVNTHHHDDHTGGNANFGKDAPIISHDNVRARLAAEGDAAREALPILTFTDSVTIHMNGDDIKLVHYASGHTDNDCVAYFPQSNVVATGDLFFNGRFPFVDIDSGGDVGTYSNNVQRIIGRIKPDTRVIPGHGALAGVEDMRTFHRMLIETGKVVRRGLMRFKPLDQIQKEGLPEEYQSYAWELVDANAWMEAIYRSVEKYQGLPVKREDKSEH